MARSTEAIQADIDRVEAELKNLEKTPPYFVVAGQVIDNRERLTYLKTRLQQLRAELAGNSRLQGPDLVV